MQQTLVPLFPTLDAFCRYAQSVDTTNTLADLESSALFARKAVESLIGKPVYEAILVSADDDLLDPLRSAIANRTMSQQLVHDAVNRRRSGSGDTYRYELEALRTAYMQSFYAAIDELLCRLDATIDPDDFASPAAVWQNSRYGLLLAKCRIRRTEQFDTLYPIDLSYHFFYRTVPLQVEVLDTRLLPYYNRASAHVLEASASSPSPLLPRLDLVLAKLTVAMALRRFDIAVFPPTLRSLLAPTKESRTAANERADMQRLAADLEAEAKAQLNDIDMVLSDHTTDITTTTSFNDPSDIIIMLP